jgi:hypothetical protein
MAKPVKNQFDWLTQAEVRQALQCTPQSLTRMVERGLIRRRDIPGRRRYWREDIEKLAEQPPRT